MRKPLDVKIQLITPYPLQRKVINAVMDKGIFNITCCMGRGAGKSILLENIALERCISIPGMKILIVSPTESNNNKIYDDIIIAMSGSGFVKTSSKQSGSAIINFYNGSKIMFRTGSNENARGLRADILIIDEAAKLRKEIVDTVFIPTLAGSKFGKVLLMSTPRGNNWFKDYFMKGTIDEKFASFRCSSYDSPFMTDNIINFFRENLPEKVFQQEVEAQFVDGASIFNNIDKLMVLDRTGPKAGEVYFGGIDVGLINDATVVSIIDSKGNLVEQIGYDKIETPELIEELNDIHLKWNFRKIYIESNGQGLPVYQSLKRKIRTLEEFNTNATSKPLMIDALIYLFNTSGFNLIKDETLREELEAFIFIQSESGKMKYQADFGFHDDRVMSLAIARKCYDDNKQDTNYMSRYRSY